MLTPLLFQPQGVWRLLSEDRLLLFPDFRLDVVLLAVRLWHILGEDVVEVGVVVHYFRPRLCVFNFPFYKLLWSLRQKYGALTYALLQLLVLLEPILIVLILCLQSLNEVHRLL